MWIAEVVIFLLTLTFWVAAGLVVTGLVVGIVLKRPITGLITGLISAAAVLWLWL